MFGVSSSAHSPILDLFSLPLFQIENIVRRCEPAEIIASTFLFDAMNEQIQKIKLNGRYLTYNHNEGIHSLYLDLGLYKTPVNIEVGGVDTKNVQLAKINGIEMRMSRTVERNCKEWKIKGPDGYDQERILGEMINHLLKVVKFRDLRFSTSSDILNLRELPIFHHGPELGLIEIRQDNYNAINITADHLNFLLDELNAREISMKVRVLRTGDSYFYYEKPFKAQKVDLDNISWVTTECFLGNNLVTVNLMGRTRIPLNYNAIMHHWLNGGHPNLERFIVRETNAAVNFRDIKVTPTLFTEMDFRRRTISFEGDGKDIRRNSDGLLASLITTTEDVQWCVWPAKFHMFCVPATFKKLKEMLKNSDF